MQALVSLTAKRRRKLTRELKKRGYDVPRITPEDVAEHSKPVKSAEPDQVAEKQSEGASTTDKGDGIQTPAVVSDAEKGEETGANLSANQMDTD